jgi:hypothetical protein
LFEEIRQAAGKGKAVNALCQMTGLNRAGYYRWRVPRAGTPVKMELCDERQEVALLSRSCRESVVITKDLRRNRADCPHSRMSRKRKR